MMTPLDIADHIISKQQPNQRLIVALAGAPASGKSSLAKSLADAIGPRAIVVPMDGFHLDNRVLHDRGIFSKKGAPETFDAAGFYALVQRLRTQDQVAAPVFDRAQDLSIAGARMIEAHHQIVLIEGAYLLLDRAPWNDHLDLWDVTIWLDVPVDILEQRLVARWIDHAHTPAQAKARAQGNDMTNIRLVNGASLPAMLTVQNHMPTDRDLG